jgi:hypothetical protein
MISTGYRAHPSAGRVGGRDASEVVHLTYGTSFFIKILSNILVIKELI